MVNNVLALSTGSFYPTPTEDALVRIALLGFNQAEITIQNSDLNYDFHRHFQLDHLERLRNVIHGEGLRVASLHAPPLTSVESFSQRARAEILLKTLEMAALFQGNEVIVHPYHIFRSYEDACSFLSNESSEISEFAISELLPLLNRAREYGIRIAMENIAHWHDDAFLNDPDNMMRLVSSLDDNFGVDLDIFHSELGHTTSEFLDKLTDRIVSIHLCDHTESRERVFPGRGKTKWPVLAEHVRGLSGLQHVVLEMAGPFKDEELKQSADYLREVFDLEL